MAAACPRPPPRSPPSMHPPTPTALEDGRPPRLTARSPPGATPSPSRAFRPGGRNGGSRPGRRSMPPARDDRRLLPGSLHDRPPGHRRPETLHRWGRHSQHLHTTRQRPKPARPAPCSQTSSIAGRPGCNASGRERYPRTPADILPPDGPEDVEAASPAPAEEDGPLHATRSQKTTTSRRHPCVRPGPHQPVGIRPRAGRLRRGLGPSGRSLPDRPRQNGRRQGSNP